MAFGERPGVVDSARPLPYIPASAQPRQSSLEPVPWSALTSPASSSASAAMAFVREWPRRLAAECCRRGAPRAASACLP